MKLLFKSLFVFFIWLESAYSFDEIKIPFSFDSKINKDVTFSFSGYLPDKPINVLSDIDSNTPEEVQGLLSYFKGMHKVNSEGTKKDALKLWEKDLREVLDKEFSDEYFSINQVRYKKMKSIRLHLVIDYDGVLICYLSYDSDGKQDDWLVPNQLVYTEEGLMMTNRLSHDYFFKHIGPLLLSNNIKLAEAYVEKN